MNSATRKDLLAAGLAALLVAAVLFVPLANGIPKAYDLRYHLGTADQFFRGLRSGDFYPRWLPEWNDGWGEPTMVFYPPGLYFLTAFVAFWSGGDVLVGLFGALALLTVLGGLGIFFLLRPLFGARAGLVACLGFAILPYHFFEIYASGLYSAFAAGCLMPWVLLALWGIAKAKAQERRRNLAPFAWPFLFAAVILVNLPCAVLLTYLVASWAGAELLSTRRWALTRDVVLGGVWGVLLASVYLVPALVEMPFIQVPGAAGAPLYRSNFLFQTEGSWMSPGLRSLFARMGIYPALAFLLSLGVVAAARGRGSTPASEGFGSWVRLVALFGLTSFFLATPLSEPLWRFLPNLESVNLPWRLLDHFGVAAAALAAAALLLVVRTKAFPRVLRALWVPFFVALGLLCLMFGLSISSVNGRIPAATCRASIPFFARTEGYFLPKEARRAIDLRGVPQVSCDRPCRVKVLEWLPSRRTFQFFAPASTRLAVRTYFFPGWVASSLEDKRERFSTSAETGTGRLLIDLPAGERRVLLRFSSTLPRVAGALLSGLAFTAWAAWAYLLWRGTRTEGLRDQPR